MHCHDLLSTRPQDKQRIPWPRPELLIVLEQHIGLPTILAVAKSSFIFSRWIEPSGESNPDHVILSPGISDLRSLFTGPPSEKATIFTALPEENTEMVACPPFVSSGNEITVPVVEDSIWSSLS